MSYVACLVLKPQPKTPFGPLCTMYVKKNFEKKIKHVKVKYARDVREEVGYFGVRIWR